MNTSNIDTLFTGLILKVLVTMCLFISSLIAGHFAARRLSSDRTTQQALRKLISVVLFLGLVYLLVLSRYAVV